MHVLRIVRAQSAEQSDIIQYKFRVIDIRGATTHGS